MSNGNGNGNGNIFGNRNYILEPHRWDPIQLEVAEARLRANRQREQLASNRDVTTNTPVRSLPIEAFGGFNGDVEFDRRRDLRAEFGWPDYEPTAWQYQALFNEDPLANRVVTCWPSACWQVYPHVWETDDDVVTPFEQAVDDLARTLRGEESQFKGDEGNPLWSVMERCDVLSRIGQYGVVYLGFDDGLDPSLPVPGVDEDNSMPGAHKPDQPSDQRGMAGTAGEKETADKSGAADPSKPAPDDDAAEPKDKNLTANERHLRYHITYNALANPKKFASIFDALDGKPQSGDLQGEDKEGDDAERSPEDGPDPRQEGGADGDDPDVAGRLKLIFARPYAEPQARITQWETNRSSPRYNQPVMYQIVTNDPRAQRTGIGPPMSTINVHWTRVVHLACNPLSSEVLGVPAMRPVLTEVLDCRKVSGAAAEGYWKNGVGAVSFETHPQLGGQVDVDDDDLRDMFERSENSQQKFWRLSGMAAKAVTRDLKDPALFIDPRVDRICIALDFPKRIFIGSERGELASSQDDSDHNDDIKRRQNNYLTPRLVVPFFDRLVQVGALPKPSYKPQPKLDPMDAHLQGQDAGMGRDADQLGAEDGDLGMDELMDDERRQDGAAFPANPARQRPFPPRPSNNSFCPTGDGGGVDPSCSGQSAKDIKREIREHRKDMKARGIRELSMMNGGHTPESARANEHLFALKVKLEKVEKEAARKNSVTPEKVRDFLKQQGVETLAGFSPDGAFVKTVTERFNKAHSSSLSPEDLQKMATVLVANAFPAKPNPFAKGGDPKPGMGQPGGPPRPGGPPQAGGAPPKPGQPPKPGAPAAPGQAPAAGAVKQGTLHGVKQGADDERPGYHVEWPDVNSSNAAEKASTANQRMMAASAYISGQVNTLIPEKNFLVHELDYTEEEAEAFVAEGELKQIEQEEQSFQQQKRALDEGLVADPNNPDLVPDTHIGTIGQGPPGAGGMAGPPGAGGPPKPGGEGNFLPGKGGPPGGSLPKPGGFGGPKKPNPFAARNAFCPTGSGGGVDPSCAPGGNPADHQASVQGKASRTERLAAAREAYRAARREAHAGAHEDAKKEHAKAEASFDAALKEGNKIAAPDLSTHFGAAYEALDYLLTTAPATPHELHEHLGDVIRKAKESRAGLAKETVKEGSDEHLNKADRDENARALARVVAHAREGRAALRRRADHLREAKEIRRPTGNAAWPELDNEAVLAWHVANAFCATGEGGGVDPTCGRQEAARAAADHADRVAAKTAKASGDDRSKGLSAAARKTGKTAATEEEHERAGGAHHAASEAHADAMYGSADRNVAAAHQRAKEAHAAAAEAHFKVRDDLREEREARERRGSD